MDPPVRHLGLHKKFEEGVNLYHCDFMDLQVVKKTAEVLLLGLSTACVDNTTGGLFKGPESVVIDMRKEMVDYLIERSQTFVTETVIEDVPDADSSEHPIDIISDFVDDFASSKQNLFSRVSGWLLSENREDRIDDFVQEMEEGGFWLMSRREAIAQTLLKNVDFKSAFHCKMEFVTAEEFNRHMNQCMFRSMNCPCDGCGASFSAVHMEEHDSVCPFKVLPCEQNCSENIVRCEMDRHCLTVCPMKLVNCPFYLVGCQSAIPHCKTEQHLLESLDTHLLDVLRIIHKGASEEVLNQRMEQLLSSLNELSRARDVRSLTGLVKELEARMEPLQCSLPRNANGPTIQTREREPISDPSRTRQWQTKKRELREISHFLKRQARISNSTYFLLSFVK